MTTSPWRIVACCAVLLAGAQACSYSRERERVDFERMRLQQRYDLYAEGAFPNGAVVQTPPDSTVSREAVAGSITVPTAPTGTTAGIPVVITSQLLAVGRQKYTTYCAVCHGVAAFGGSVVATNMGPPRPPSLRRPAALTFPASYIFTVATHGLGRMPPYAPQLTDHERWAVVAYVQQLQRDPSRDAATLADSARGAQLARVDSIAALETRK